MPRGRQRNLLSLILLLTFSGLSASLDRSYAQNVGLPVHEFQADPQWEGFRNRLLPKKLPIVKQDFGYRESHFANGSGPGEIGGLVQRSSLPAYYAKAIPKLTLNDKLSASGKLAVTHAEGGSAAMIGWFHQSSRGWRTPNSAGFRIDGNGGKYWLFYEYGTRSHQTGGGGAFEGERYQTTPTKPFPADGTVHTWALNYDPEENDGHGVLNFRVDDKDWLPVPLPPGHKEDGAEFDRFGIWNVQAPGDILEFYIDDMIVNGERYEFASDPNWIGSGNTDEFEERIIRPFHDIGYSRSLHAGGSPGEIGGTIFRDEQPAYYAAKTELLNLDRELFASGKISLTHATSDSGVFFGWFDSTTKRNKEDPEHQSRQKNYLAILIEGPSRIGHYFRPAYSTSTGSGLFAGPDTYGGVEPPVIAPDGEPHAWSMHYNPSGAEGSGSITVTFDGLRQTLALRPGDKQAGAVFDRFGFFNLQSGGHYVLAFVDDLQYTSHR
jgi:hypothetical protein